MSRLRRATHSLASGYAAMGINILYTLASVPLALHYLTEVEFGLWSLVTVVANYLMLIDLGVTGAVSRFLLEHKDHKEDGAYGSVIKTGSLVLLVQGAAVAVGGLLISFALAGLFPKVPGDLVPIFRILVAGQCVLVGAVFSGRILMGILQAHQRFDALNYAGIAQMAVGFGVQWLAFHQGWKLYSLLAASVASAVCGLGMNAGSVLYLRLLPPPGHWGRASRKVFNAIFKFATDLFLLALGLQLLNASQVVIISWTLDLKLVAIWTVATKTFALGFQFVQRIFDFSAAALGEMMVRGEHQTLRRRYRDTLQLTAAAAGFTMAAVAVCNASFLTLWVRKWVDMRGAAHWTWVNDALMGGLVMLNCVTRCQIGLAGYAKQVATMRWVYFLEGVCFVVGAFLVAPHFGVAGIIAVAVAANILCSGTYGLRWAARYLQITPGEMLGWLRPAGKYLLLVAPITAVLWWATCHLPSLPRLAVNAAVMLLVGLSLLWHVGLTANLRQELRKVAASVRRRLTGRP